MKKVLVAFVVIAVGGLMLASPAQAYLISTTLTATPSSSVTLLLSAIGGAATGSATMGVSGTADMTFDQDLTTPPQAIGVQLDDADFTLSDASLTVSLGFLGGVSAATFSLHLGGEGPMVGATPIGGGMSVADFGGTTLELDGGTVTYKGTGAIGGLLGSGTFDFSSAPLALVLPPGSTVTISEALVGVGTTAVTVDIPLAFMDTITTDPVDVAVDLSGLITLTGLKIFIIPEPATWVMIGLGLVGIIPLVRRKLRK
jgi:hypothetical protein